MQNLCGTLWGRLGAPWGPLGAPWGPLGDPWGPLGPLGDPLAQGPGPLGPGAQGDKVKKQLCLFAKLVALLQPGELFYQQGKHIISHM